MNEPTLSAVDADSPIDAKRAARSFAEQFAAAVEREKLLALKEFAYGASHELNNPLANIAGRAQSLLAGETNPQRRLTLASIAAQAMRAHEMISDLMLFAKPPTIVIGAVDLIQLVTTAVEQCKRQTWHRSFEIAWSPRVSGSQEREAIVEGDASHLTAALVAILRNAIEAEGGEPRRIQIELTASAGETPSIAITIADNGAGITDEQRPRIFDPFYSGREAGRGLGFGLSKAWRIVELHHGRIEVVSPLAKHSSGAGGASFTIVLPRKFSPSVS